jgi:hypothetical protein
MMVRWWIRIGIAVIGTGVLAVSLHGVTSAAQNTALAIDQDDLAGVVTSDKGPEAGVWVIAETDDLPTKFSKIVVTDDRGRYLLPDLPKANYSIWVRGYGLVDSERVQSMPGTNLNLRARLAPNARAAAAYYPAAYWFSLLQVPDKKEFPGTGRAGNGISPSMKTQSEWVRQVKTDGCWACHQLGNKATREIPSALGTFKTHAEAWDRRIQSGQAGGYMAGGITGFGKERALRMFGDWTTRIAGGELPPAPKRPEGIERNIVVTQWDWADDKSYLHDEISTDKRNPTLNANGLIYGSPESSTDNIPILDPVKHTATIVKMPVRDANTPGSPPVLLPSPYWGDEAIWDSKADMHNPMFDELGRVWFTSRIRANDNPAWCKAGSSHPSAKVLPLPQSNRQLAVYDPRTKKFELIDTCFGTHHLNFAEDANRTLWVNSFPIAGPIGWLNTKMWDQTHDAQKSQGWTPVVLDSNGNGKRDAFTEPDQPADPAKDRRLNASLYSIAVSPADGSVWGTWLGFPGTIVRIAPGPDPATTAISEVYEPPTNKGYSPRGIDIDQSGVVWVPLASGHFASFDRRKCKVTNGPTATGQHCPEGWTFYPFPAPQLKGLSEPGSAEASYYNWVDRFDTFGLGRNVPIATGNGTDSLLVLQNGKWVILRVPYPIGFFAKGIDGRIDDAKAGWKGRSLWSTHGGRAPFHLETGKGTKSKVVRFQLRPSPIAK